MIGTYLNLNYNMQTQIELNLIENPSLLCTKKRVRKFLSGFSVSRNLKFSFIIETFIMTSFQLSLQNEQTNLSCLSNWEDE